MALNFNTQTALVQVYAWGAGGAGGTSGGWNVGSRGGGGGFASGKMIARAGEIYRIVVGGGGIVNMGGLSGEGNRDFVEGGGSSPYATLADNKYAGSGGGYSGIFLNVVNTQSTAIILAGGGGGGGSSRTGPMNSGGAGGGVCGQRGQAAYDWTTYFGSGGGGGGTQIAGGVATSSMTFNGQTGSALYGGRITTYAYGGGGGGGWFGGAGGGYIEANTMGGGGGGSGYLSSSTIYCGLLITGCLATPACNTNGYRGLAGRGGEPGQGGEFGRVVITYPGPQQAHGGVVTTNSGTTIHTFDRSGVFGLYGTPFFGMTSTQVEMLIVGGGGGGGTNMGGGGGGGAVVNVLSTLTNGAYMVTVGQGGSGFCGTCGSRGGHGQHSWVGTATQYSYSYHFDGPNDYIWTTSTTVTSPVGQGSTNLQSNAVVSQNFTIEGWYWFADGAIPANRVMMQNYQTTYGVNSIFLGKHVGYQGKVTFWAGSFDTTRPMLIDPTYPPTGRWIHYAISRNNTDFTMFRDGVAVSASSTSTAVSYHSVASTYISAASTLPGNGNGFRGYISNFRITNGNSVYTTGVNTSTASTTPFSGVFNGRTDYLVVPSNPYLNLGANSFTLEAWINMQILPQTLGSGGAYVIAQKGLTSVSNFEWSFIAQQSSSTTSTYNLAFQQSDLGTTATVSTATSLAVPLTTATWQHVAISVSGGTASFWIDGKSAGTASGMVTLYSGIAPLSIGASFTGTNFFNGYISNIRLVNGSALYSSPFTPSVTPLTSVTNTVLLTLQNSTFIDNAWTASTITSYGTPGIWANSPFSTATQIFSVPIDQLGRVQSSSTNIKAVIDRTKSGVGSIFFNGVGDYLTLNTSYTISVSSATTFFNNFTVETWFMPTVAQAGTIIDTRATATAVPWYIQVNASNQVIFNWGASSLTTTLTLNIARWNHIAVSRLAGIVTIWINGIRNPATGSLATAILPTSTYARIGASIDATPVTYLNGFFTNLRIARNEAIYPNNTWTFSAYSFNGTTDAISASSSSLFAFPADFTIECWIYPTSVSTTASYIFDQRTTEPQSVLAIYITPSTNVLNVYLNGAVVITGGAVLLNNWNHIALNRTSSSMKLFLNGVQIGTTYTSAVQFASAPFTIGRKYDSTQYFVGNVSNFRVVNTVGLYNTTPFTPPTTQLFAIPGTTLLTLQTSTIVDSGPYTNAITIEGSPTFVATISTSSNYIVVPQNVLTTTTSTTLLLKTPYVNWSYSGGSVSGNSANIFTHADSSLYNMPLAAGGTTYPGFWSPYASTGSAAILTAQSPLVPVDYSYNTNVMAKVSGVNVNVTATLFSPFYPELIVTPKTEISYSVLFNAGYLSLSNNAALVLSSGFSWTLEMWFYCTGGSGYRTLISKRTGVSYEYEFGIDPSGNLYFWNGSITYGAAVTNNAWHHFAAVQDGANLTMYLDGVSSTPAAVNANASTNPVFIGTDGTGYTQNFPGYISNLRIVKDSAIYTGSTFSPPTAPLSITTQTSLLALQSSSIIDNSNNNFSISVSGGASVTSSHPFNYPLNYSAYFDGYGNASNILVTATNFSTQNLTLPLDFTIECWINTSGAQDNNTFILNKGGIPYASYGLSIGWPNVYFMASLNNTNYTIGGDAPTQAGFIGAIKSNTWNHIAVTRQGGTFRGFVNGVQGMTSSTTATSQFFDTGIRGLAIGSSYTTNWGVAANLTSPYSGYMSNLRIIRGQALYTGNFAPPTTALTTTTVGTLGSNVTATLTGTVLLLAFQSQNIYEDKSNFGYRMVMNGMVYPQTQNPFSNVTSLGPTSALAMGGGGGASHYGSKAFPASIGANGGGMAGQGSSAFTGGGAGAPGIMGVYGGGFTGAATSGTNIHFPGGGGGAGGSGFSGGVFTTGPKGGIGVPNTILGKTYYFGGGGGGAGYNRAAGCGGQGGGGGGAPKSTSSGGYGDRASIFRAQDGGYGSLVAAANQPGGWGAPNSGGGGGGGSHQTTFGGAGGSGIVVIKYTGVQKAVGGVITTDGTSTIHTFYSSGIFTLLGTPIYPMAMGGRGGGGYAGGGQGSNSFANYGGPGGRGNSANSGTSVYFGGSGAGGGSCGCYYFAGGGGGAGISGLVNLYSPGGAPGANGTAGNGGTTSTQNGNGGLFGAGGAGSKTCYYNVCWGNGGSGAVLITYNTTSSSFTFPNPSPAAYSSITRTKYPYGQNAGVSSSTFLVFSTSTSADRYHRYAFYNSVNAATVPGYEIFNTGKSVTYDDPQRGFSVSRIPQASCVFAGSLQITSQITAHCMMMKNNDRCRPVTSGNQPGNYQVIQEVTKANDPRLVNARVANFIVGVTGVGCGTSTGVVTTVNQFWTS